MSRGQRSIGSNANKMFAVCLATIMALLILLLPACGSNLGGQEQKATPISTRASQVQKCGTVHSLHSQLSPADKNTAGQTELCFWQAFQHCQPATLIYSKNGLDAGTVNTFTLKSIGGKCIISNGVQHYIAPHPPGNTTLYTCSNVNLQSDGLYISSCGEAGTIIVPSK